MSGRRKAPQAPFPSLPRKALGPAGAARGGEFPKGLPAQEGAGLGGSSPACVAARPAAVTNGAARAFPGGTESHTWLLSGEVSVR